MTHANNELDEVRAPCLRDGVLPCIRQLHNTLTMSDARRTAHKAYSGHVDAVPYIAGRIPVHALVAVAVDGWW